MRKGEFNDEDKKLAGQAHAVFMRQINGSGLRYDFDLKPGQVEAFCTGNSLRSARYHRDNYPQFTEWIREFGGFVVDLAHFKDRPVIHSPSKGREVTLTIDDQHIRTYGSFFNALEEYAVLLNEHGPSHAHLSPAVAAVASIVHRSKWRQAGHPVLKDITDMEHLPTRNYLEAVMRWSPANQNQVV